MKAHLAFDLDAGARGERREESKVSYTACRLLFGRLYMYSTLRSDCSALGPSCTRMNELSDVGCTIAYISETIEYERRWQR